MCNFPIPVGAGLDPALLLFWATPRVAPTILSSISREKVGQRYYNDINRIGIPACPIIC